MKRQRVIKQVCLLNAVFITVQAYEVTASGVLPCATELLGKTMKNRSDHTVTSAALPQHVQHTANCDALQPPLLQAFLPTSGEPITQNIMEVYQRIRAAR